DRVSDAELVDQRLAVGSPDVRKGFSTQCWGYGGLPSIFITRPGSVALFQMCEITRPQIGKRHLSGACCLEQCNGVIALGHFTSNPPGALPRFVETKPRETPQG